MADADVDTEAQFRANLTPEQYEILRQRGTERPFSGEYVYSKESGTYQCAACGAELFSLRDQVRLRHRLAELHRARDRGKRGAASRIARTGCCAPR